jgi:hypothetical protein
MSCRDTGGLGVGTLSINHGLGPGRSFLFPEPMKLGMYCVHIVHLACKELLLDGWHVTWLLDQVDKWTFVLASYSLVFIVAGTVRSAF